VSQQSYSQNRYFYRITGDRKVYIYQDERRLALLKGTRAVEFIDSVAALAGDEKQKYIDKYIHDRI
jgi:hypothetical protein